MENLVASARNEIEKFLDKRHNLLQQKINLKDLTSKLDKITDKNFDSLLNMPQIKDHKVFPQIYYHICKINSQETRKKFKDLILYLACKQEANLATYLQLLKDLTNNWMDIDILDENLLLQFLLFKCLIKEEYHKSEIFPLIKYAVNSKKLIKYQYEVVVELCLILAINFKWNNVHELEEEDLFSIIDKYIKNQKIKIKPSILRIVICYLLMSNISDFDSHELSYLLENFIEQFMLCILEIQHLENKEIDTEDFFTWTDLSHLFYFEKSNEFLNENFPEALNEYKENYKIFFNKNNPNIILIKSKKNILSSLLVFLTSSIEETNTLNDYIGFILKFLNQLIKISNLYSNEILRLLFAIIKQKGETLFSEWVDIFGILFNGLLYNQINPINDNIIEQIHSLYLKDEFHGEFSKVRQFLLSNQTVQNENVIILKISLWINSKENFVAFFEEALKYIFTINKEDYPNLIQFFFDLIRTNFIKANSLLREDKRKKVIEECLIKHYESFVELIKGNEILNSQFIYLFSEILSVCNDLDFFKKINNKIVNHKCDSYKEIIVDLYCHLFTKLSNHNMSKHIIILKKMLFSLKNFKTNLFILSIALNLIKKCVINRNYEIMFTPIQTNETKITKASRSLLILDYKNQEIKKKKEKLKEKYKEYKDKVYSPYIPFNNNKIFMFVFNYIKDKEKLKELENKENEEIIKEMFEYILKCFVSIYLIDMLDLYDIIDFLNEDMKENDITTKNSNDIFVLKGNILLNVAYHLNLKTNSIFLQYDSIFKSSKPKDDLLPLKMNCILTFLSIWKTHICPIDFSTNNNNIKLPYCSVQFLKFFLVSSIESFNPLPSIDKYTKKPLNSNNKYILSSSFVESNFSPLLLLLKFIINAIIGTLLTSEYNIETYLIVVSFLYETKEIFFSLNEEILFKLIFILLSIGWQNKLNEITIALDKYFSFENTSFISELEVSKDIFQKKKIDKPKDEKSQNLNLETVFYEFIDLVTLSYLNNFTAGEILFKVIDECFKEPKTLREFTFYELSKWNLFSRTSRNSLDFSEDDKKYKKLTQLYIGDNNIIMAIPLEINKTKLIFRNAISNQTIVFSPIYNDEEFKEFVKNKRKNFYSKDDIILSSNVNLIPNKIQKLKKRNVSNCRSNTIKLLVNFRKEELKRIEKDEQDRIKITNMLVNQIISLTSRSIEQYIHIQFNPNKFKIFNSIYEKLTTLDENSPFFINYCGILFIPDTDNLPEDSLYAYNDEISESYMNFIGRLGKVVNITKASSPVNVGSIMNKDGFDGKLIIQYTDSLTQLVFHVSNLITTVENRKSILQNDNIILAWNDNPNREFDIQLINKYSDILIFIIVCPISPTHYLIKRQYNTKAREKVREIIEMLFPNNFHINIITNNSLQQLIMMIIEIGYIIKMSREEENKEQENVFGKRREILSSIINLAKLKKFKNEK